MSVVCEWSGPNGRWRILAAVLFLVAVASPVVAQTRNANAGVIAVEIDQAQVLKLPAGVATLVVGNPLIADVSVQPGGVVVLTAKGFGVTNLVALGRAGEILEQKTIEVQGARDSVVVYRGAERESYSCTPNCERRLTLGDSMEYFTQNSAQVVTRATQAAAAAAPAK